MSLRASAKSWSARWPMPARPRQAIQPPSEKTLPALGVFTDLVADEAERVLVASVVIRKIDGLTDAELRASRLPSGWTPLELLKHLAYMERRWLRWGLRAEQLPDPHGDEDQTGRWHAGPGDTAASLIAALHAAGEQTRAIASAAELTDISAPAAGSARTTPGPCRRWRGSSRMCCRSMPATPGTTAGWWRGSLTTRIW
jgi:Protein of unknown function (DUF664)